MPRPVYDAYELALLREQAEKQNKHLLHNHRTMSDKQIEVALERLAQLRCRIYALQEQKTDLDRDKLAPNQCQLWEMFGVSSQEEK